MDNIKNLGVLNKNVSLVHSSGTLTAMQRKLINVLLYKSLKDGEKKDKYMITMKEVVGLLSYNSHDYLLLKKSIMGLITAPVELDIYDGKPSDEWQVSSLLASARAYRGGLLEFSFSPIIMELIFEPEKYAKINMDESLSLKSQYSLAIYELCARFLNIKQTSWIEISRLRKLLGISEDKYPQFKELNRRAISPAVEEINKKTSMRVSFEIETSGRRASRIKFSVSGAGQKKFSISPSVDKNKAISGDKKLNSIGMSEAKYNELVSVYQKEKVDLAIEYTIDKMKSPLSPPRKPLSYLISLLSTGVDLAGAKKIVIKKIDYIEENRKYDTYLLLYTKDWILNATEGQINELCSKFKRFCAEKIMMQDFVITSYQRSLEKKEIGDVSLLMDVHRFFEVNNHDASSLSFSPKSRRDWHEGAKEGLGEKV